MSALVEKIVLAEKLARVADHWSPKIVAKVDGYEVKLVKIKGDFVWHKHDAEDELFLVIKGRFRKDFRDRAVDIGPGELIVVPCGVEYKPFAQDECEILLLERAGVVNTGDVRSARTVLAPESL